MDRSCLEHSMNTEKPQKAFPLSQCSERIYRRHRLLSASAPNPEITAMNAPTAFPGQNPFRPTSTRRCFRWATDATPYKRSRPKAYG